MGAHAETMVRIVMYLCALAAIIAISESLNTAELPFATEDDFIEDEVVPELIQTGCNEHCPQITNECNTALTDHPKFKKEIKTHFNPILKNCKCGETCGAEAEEPKRTCDCSRVERELEVESEAIRRELENELHEAQHSAKMDKETHLNELKSKHESASSKKEADQIVAAYEKKMAAVKDEYEKKTSALKQEADEDLAKKKAYLKENCPSCDFD